MPNQISHEVQMQEEIERILNLPEDQMPVEQAMPPQDSPLNQPVADKEFAQTPPEQAAATPEDVPIEMLQLAADSILTTVDNVIGLGAGYFVKIKRHKEFVEIEEVIQLIDEQNERNVNAMKLDDEDRAMLTPLLVQVLRKRAKVPTPEQQLLMIAATILMKKGRMFLQIRAENQALAEQMLVAIRETKESEAAPVPPQVFSHAPVQEQAVVEETEKRPSVDVLVAREVEAMPDVVESQEAEREVIEEPVMLATPLQTEAESNIRDEPDAPKTKPQSRRERRKASANRADGKKVAKKEDRAIKTENGAFNDEESADTGAVS